MGRCPARAAAPDDASGGRTVASRTGGERLARLAGSGAGLGGRRGTVRTAGVGAAALVVGVLLTSCGSRLPAAEPGPTAATPATTAVPTPPVPTLQGAVTAGRFVRAVRVGGLQVVPDPGERATAPLGLDLSAATTYAGYASALTTPGSRHLAARDVIGFGRVTLGGVALPPGVPGLSATPAWVAIAPPSTGAVSCPAMTVPGPGATTTTSPYRHGVYTAVVFFGAVAHGGAGAVRYSSGGSLPCGGSTGPRAAAAIAEVPVAWQVTGRVGPKTTVRYQAPACAHPGGSTGGGNVRTGVMTENVRVDVPFDRTGCGAVRSFTTVLTLFPTAPGAPPPPSRIVLQHAAVPPVPPAIVGALGGH